VGPPALNGGEERADPEVVFDPERDQDSGTRRFYLQTRTSLRLDPTEVAGA
jgi:hypothetical protein